VLYQINEGSSLIKRQFPELVVTEQPYANKLKAAFYSELPTDSAYFEKTKNTQSAIVFELGGIRGANSIFRGKIFDAKGKPKGPFKFSVKESYSVADFTDYSAIDSWSSETEPCETNCDASTPV